MGEVLLGCSGWNYPDTADKVVGLAYFIPIRIPKGFVIILNSLTQQRWTLLFMTDSITEGIKSRISTELESFNLIITNGRVIDPERYLDDVHDVDIGELQLIREFL
jgi:hypothetical protein